MLKTKPEKEIVVRMPNAIGTLGEVARIVADKGVNILAASAWVEGEQAVIRLVTDDTVRVVDALKARQYDVQEGDVLMTEPAHKPGMLHRLTERLAQAGIDIRHLYATAGASQERCVIVFATANNERALLELNVPEPTA
jgi:hypothetical protein